MGSAQTSSLPIFGAHAPDYRGEQALGKMKQSAVATQAYRPEVEQARMNALRQQMSAWEPVNQALGQMYGPGAQLNTAEATRSSPMSPRMSTVGAPGKTGTGTGGQTNEGLFMERALMTLMGEI